MDIDFPFGRPCAKPGRKGKPPIIDPLLAATLLRVAELLADAARPWWIIGSAAVALHGAPLTVRRDVDVLVDAADMPALADKAGGRPDPGVSDGRFRSALVLRLPDTPLAIELFAGLHVHGDDGWCPLRPLTREPVRVDNATLFVPDARELIEILRWLGRGKDCDRADLLRATLG